MVEPQSDSSDHFFMVHFFIFLSHLRGQMALTVEETSLIKCNVFFHSEVGLSVIKWLHKWQLLPLAPFPWFCIVLSALASLFGEEPQQLVKLKDWIKGQHSSSLVASDVTSLSPWSQATSLSYQKHKSLKSAPTRDLIYTWIYTNNEERLIEVDDLCVHALFYLGSQMAFLDLWDVGMSHIQCVEIHSVELVVEQLSKLPGKIVVALKEQHTYQCVTCRDHSSVQ